MKENSYLPNCNDNDVIAFEENNLTKLGRFKNAIVSIFKQDIGDAINNLLSSKYSFKIPATVYIKDCDNNQVTYNNKWLEEGIYCELLQLGAKDWQKGKIRVRVTVEFVPDEPELTESLLDDIRQSITEEN